MRAVRIACVGHATLDHVFEVDALPATPTKTPVHRYRPGTGGMSFNAAIAAARLGAAVRLIGRVGDEPGVHMLRDIALGRLPDLTGKVVVVVGGGDTAMRLDEEGYYYLTDRRKHIIISGGENISPKEVEAVINRVDGVAESCVVGIPDEKWGEKVVAAVVPKQGASLGPQSILSLCKEKLHSWKCPKEIRFLETLPRNTMGKVLKKEVEKVFLP